jgi:uncharacterized membrane protein YfhO
MDIESAQNALIQLSGEQFKIADNWREDDFKGTYTANNEATTVLTTLPYDEGWKLYVDGEPVEYTKALGALIAFEIEGSGEHTVRLKYAPKTFTLGLTISILSTALFVLIIIIEKPLTVVLSKIFSSNEAAEKEQDTEDDELANSENENDNVE